MLMRYQAALRSDRGISGERTDHTGARPRGWDLRAMVDAVLYLLWTGCQWRALPRDFPPRTTVQGYFYRWRDDGTWSRINAELVARARQRLGRALAPSAGIIDSQSVPT